MAKVRMKRYEQAGISRERYMELKYLARQYDSMKRWEAKLRRGEIDRAEGGNRAWRQSDPTGNAAVGIAVKSKADKIRAIEDAARVATAGMPGMYKLLMRNVTKGEEERVLQPCCGHAQFCALRRRFYVELDRRIA